MVVQGQTTMMITKIPHFREVVVCSFECDHCGNRYVSSIWPSLLLQYLDSCIPNSLLPRQQSKPLLDKTLHMGA